MIIKRTNEQTNTTQIINVPISYAEKEKMLTRVLGDPKIDRKDAQILPRISFFMDGFEYDHDRKIASTNKYIINQGNNQLGFQFAEVPWAFDFKLWIYVKNNEDATKILEQILPFFSPTYTIRAFLIPNRPSVDIPITLKTITHVYTEDEKFTDREMLIWELQFTMKANFYSPIHKAPVIDTIQIDLYAGLYNAPVEINNKEFGISNNLYTQATDYFNSLDVAIDFTPGIYTANGDLLATNTIPIPLYNQEPINISGQSNQAITLDNSNTVLEFDQANINPKYGLIRTVEPGGAE